MQSNDRRGIAQHLSNFKIQGRVNFPAVLAVPSSDRIQSLIKLPDGRETVSIALTAAISSAVSNLNLRLGLTEDQMIDIAELIIDQSAEDNLALEDVLLFLHKLIIGDCGKIYDRLDIATFFEMFEVYRQERHEALKDIQYEKHVNQKAMGDANRTSDETDHEAHRSALNQHLKTIYGQPKP